MEDIIFLQKDEIILAMARTNSYYRDFSRTLKYEIHLDSHFPISAFIEYFKKENSPPKIPYAIHFRGEEDVDVRIEITNVPSSAHEFAKLLWPFIYSHQDEREVRDYIYYMYEDIPNSYFEYCSYYNELYEKILSPCLKNEKEYLKWNRRHAIKKLGFTYHCQE